MVDVNSFLQSLVPPALVVIAVLIAMRKQSIPADDRLLQMIDRLQKRVDELEKQLGMVQAWATKLSAQVVSLGAQPIAIADIEPAANGTIHSMSREPAKLLKLLQAHFTIDEIESLAFELGARAGALGEGDIDARALRLVRYAEERGRTLDLAFAIWRERPNEVK